MRCCFHSIQSNWLVKFLCVPKPYHLLNSEIQCCSRKNNKVELARRKMTNLAGLSPSNIWFALLNIPGNYLPESLDRAHRGKLFLFYSPVLFLSWRVAIWGKEADNEFHGHRIHSLQWWVIQESSPFVFCFIFFLGMEWRRRERKLMFVFFKINSQLTIY